MNVTNKPNPDGSTNGFQSQLQVQQQNGWEQGSSRLRPTKPYPAPTARYQDIVRDANLFWGTLQAFHKILGTKYKVATVGGTSLDLHRLFVEVTSRGGIEKVIVDRKWKEVILTFNFKDTITSASFVVRKSYLSMLYHYEQVYYFGRQGIPPPTPGLNPNSKMVAESMIMIVVGFIKPQDVQTSVRGGVIDSTLTSDLMIRGQSGQPYSSTTIPEVAAVNDSPVQSTPVQAHDDMVSGTIDAKFDGGYVVTVILGSEQLKGVLFHVPDNVSQSSHAEGTSSSQNLGDGTSNSQSRKRAKYAPRDPFRPKSNRSGYNFFFAENYARLKPSYHGQERAISKRIGFLWNNLSEAERQVYQEKGMRDKERYRTELMEYKSNNSTPNAQ
ncbi:High mobility group B protein 10 [Glycine soja]|nr:High mobility group B protein 10 [Glycine max]